ncbi:MAG: glycosyltransferase, partial [Bacteroidota bacterium]|nr:glycosyltransferase [Bacteroidota bacterium]
LLFKIKKYSYVFLQREAAPLGPPIFEWLYIKLCGKKLIYDFDDAIWLENASQHNSLSYILRNPGKVKYICKLAYRVSCGNEYLCSYAKQFNSNVVYNPTCVDTEKRHNIISTHNVSKITIGWTGTFSTLKYLDIVIPSLKKLQEKYDFNIKIICNQQPLFEMKNLSYVEWTEQNEVAELASCQIGLMPLTIDEWSEGKCGFKLIQYLSLGIPAVSSPVGVNKKIIEQGKNGFLCTNDAEWYNAIEKLILDSELRQKMGEEGRKKIVNEYSLLSNKENFLGLFS